ncbi:MAG: HAD family acid phosphatase [Metamycoplasmataceae bacterium]
MKLVESKILKMGALFLGTPLIISTMVISCSKNEILDKEEMKNDDSALLSNLWNSVSAEKDSMSIMTYNLANETYNRIKNQEIIEKTAKLWDEKNKTISVKNINENKSIPVVFMDLDETVINNFPYNNSLIMENKNFESSTWTKWINSEKATEIKGSIEFIKNIWRNGGVVMFNSNRKMSEHKNSTMNNLIKLGLPKELMPDWIWWMNGVDLLSLDPWKNNSKSYFTKEERMNYVSTKKINVEANNSISFKVIMKIGDDFNDFNDNFSKGKTHEEKRNILNTELKNLFGNLDVNNLGKYFNPITRNWEKLNYSQSYIMIGGNSSYGSFLNEIISSAKTTEQKINLIKSILKKYTWGDNYNSN